MQSKTNGAVWALGLLCAVAMGSIGACSGDDGSGSDNDSSSSGGPQGGCPDDAEFFQEHVYAPLLGQKCIVCHAEGGLAQKTRMVLDADDTDEARAANFEAVRSLAQVEAEGTSVLLLRPTGRHPEGHTGGKLVDLGTSEYDALSVFVDRVVEGKCDSAIAACEGPSVGARVLRRLTRSEYDATVSDLFGIQSKWGAAFTADTVVNGFDNNSNALAVSPLLADQARRAAEEIADTVFQSPGAVVPCDPVSVGEAKCADTFLDSFGKRAFRRPLDEADHARYLALFNKVAAEDGFMEGAKIVVTAMLQSPHFLYRAELGGTAKAGVVSLTPHEVASELSYLFWGTMPDQALFAAADAGKLSTPDEIASQAERLLQDEKSDVILDRFVDEWLLVENIVNVPKDETIFPGFDATIRAAMRDETRAAFRKVLRGGEPTLSALLLADHTAVAPELASFYGYDGAPGPDGLVDVDLSGSESLGILTRGSVLATHARPTDSSPIHRGKLIRTRVLCQDLPPPPAGFNVQPPPLDPSLTTRERYIAHASQEPCTSCHKLMDPIGFGFERFDGVGRFRSTENGKAIDAAGEIVSTGHTNGDFDGTGELMKSLAGSPDAGACFSLQWVRFAYGIEEGPETQCLVDQVAKDFVSGGSRIDTLLMSLAKARHFIERTADPEVSGDPDPSGSGGAGGMGGAGGAGGGQGGAGAGDPVGQDLVVTLKKDNQWETGYCASVTVENKGSATVTWEISIAVEGNITDVWNAVESPDGDKTKFVGVEYNSVLDSGESASFGFCASL